ncbi:hypothetical protein I547_7161 [Mycobacterium kansasii 824]|nr:hypothetical protein I547_7161 [Mycobacterium kansasii 824]
MRAPGDQQWHCDQHGDPHRFRLAASAWLKVLPVRYALGIR